MTETGTDALTCPKCQGSMRTYERSGVVIEQCTECRGIFLDRGELERLIDAETAHYDAAGPGQSRDPRMDDDPDDRWDHSDRGRQRGRSRRGGFLGDLLDFG
jgi:uncharacterized protein